MDNNLPIGHKTPTTGTDPSAECAFDQYTFTLHSGFITHLDSLTHVFDSGRLCNGFLLQSVTETGAQRLDVLQLKDGIFTRGILSDIPRLRELSYIKPGEAIYPEDLERWDKKAGIKVDPGDVVLIRTGR